MADSKTQERINQLKKDQISLEEIINTKYARHKKDAKIQLEINKEELEVLKEKANTETKVNTAAKVRNKLISKALTGLRENVQLNDKDKKAKKTIAAAAKITADSNEDAFGILTYIEEKEKEILNSMTEKGLLNYDAIEVMKDIEDLQEQVLELDGEDAEILKKRLMLVQEEHEFTAKSAEKVQAKNKFLDIGLGTMNMSVAAIKSMTKQTIKFVLAAKKHPFMALAGLILAVGGGLFKAFTLTKDLSKEMGVGLKNAAGIAYHITTATFSLEGGILKTLGKDFTTAAQAIQGATGGIAEINKKALIAVSTLSAMTGATEESVAKVSKMYSDINNMSFKSGTEFTNSLRALAKSNLVDEGMLIADMAASTEDMATWSKESTSNFEMAAIQARQMGLSIATTTKMAKGLLDFETSIAAQMKASLMTGKNLNYDRARMLALDNDIVGATNEIVKQLGGMAEFTKMNALQRESLAESIGVEVGELTRLINGRPLEMTPDQKQEKLQKSNISATRELTSALSALNPLSKEAQKTAKNWEDSIREQKLTANNTYNISQTLKNAN